MKKFILMLFILVMPLQGAMTTSAAKKTARDLWGPYGGVASIERYNQSQIKQVGIYSPGCATNFVVFGEGISDFSLAFQAAAANPPKIHGPYRGIINLKADARDNIGVTEFEWFIDSYIQIKIPTNPQPKVEILTPFDTRTLSNGLHYICKIARDATGNYGISNAVLFRVDQIAGGTLIDFIPETEVFRISPKWPVN